jgi:limonene-1,2-epoxide hydrolase
MEKPIEVISKFIQSWEKIETLYDGFREYFSSDTVWESVGFAEVKGSAEAVALMQTAVANGDIKGIDVQVHNIIAEGNKVMTERTEHYINAEGGKWGKVRVMGIFEVSDNKITAWRDYFDTAAIAGSH